MHTDPDCRRRGAGSALLAEAERMARAASRTTLMGEVTSGVDGTPRAAHWFAAAHGFVESLPETRRDLALPVDDALLDALEAEALAKAGGYRLVTYVDAVPSELLQGRARLAERIATDAPMGELDWREERWDTARVRRAEAEAVEMGRRLWATAAIAPDGSMAGVSGLSVSMAAPDRVFQWDTVVDREHRGHRLGLLLKVVNLRVVQRACRQARRVITWNASDNTHMVSINERMGYVPAELEAEWQKRLT